MGGLKSPAGGPEDACKRVSEAWRKALGERLPVNLSARLATGSVRLAALREMGAGAVVPLSTPVGEPARLVADGVVIGAGEIVEIQRRLALRLTRVGDGHE